MEHIRTKEQAMAWLMHNKQIRKKRLKQLQAIAIKKYEERTGLKKVTIDPKDLEDDDRAQYILNK